MSPARRAYLDWNATAPPLDAAVEAMARAAREAWGNPSSVHAFGRAARAFVEDARQAVADLAGADPRDVVFTSGGTEANNIAIRSAFAASPGTLVTSRLEHPSVTRVAEALEREGRARVRWLRVLAEGTVDLEDLAAALADPEVRLLALQAVNSETGVVQPAPEAIAMARRRGVRVHVDAVQAFGRLETAGEGADTRSVAAHKIRGPKGIGAIVSRPGLALSPVLVGGSQERGVRPGTADPVAAAGFAAAARHATTSARRWADLRVLRDRLEREVVSVAALRGGARVHGSRATRAPHVTNVVFAGWSGPELVAALDLEGIAASSGSACSAGTAEPSPALLAMGATPADASSVRFSLGETTMPEDIDAAADALARILARP